MIIHLFENDISQNARSKVPEILKQSTSCSPAATLADIRGNLAQVLFNLDRHDEVVPYVERALDDTIDTSRLDHSKSLMCA